MCIRQRGQTLTEYGLIGCCILGLCLVVLSPLGGILGNLFAQMTPKVSEGTSLTGPAIGLASTSITTTLGGEPGPLGGFPKVAGSNSVDSSMPIDLSKLVQTAGANGTTKIMSDQIKQIGVHLLATGEITADQASLFTELANQGNRISTMEKLVEDAMSSGSFRSRVTFEGRTYTVGTLVSHLGWYKPLPEFYNTPPPTAEAMLALEPEARSESMQQFLESYQRLKLSGAMTNPQVSMAVSSLSAKISYLSEVMEDTVYRISTDQGTQSLQDSVISNTSYWSSDQICGTGSGQTTGVTCK